MNPLPISNTQNLTYQEPKQVPAFQDAVEMYTKGGDKEKLYQQFAKLDSKQLAEAGNSRPRVAGFIIKNFLHRMTGKDFKYMVTHCAEEKSRCVGEKEHPSLEDVKLALNNADFCSELDEGTIIDIADTYGYGYELLLSLYKSMIDDPDIQAIPPLPLDKVEDLRTALVKCLETGISSGFPQIGLIQIKNFVNIIKNEKERHVSVELKQAFMQKEKAINQMEKIEPQLEKAKKQLQQLVESTVSEEEIRAILGNLNQTINEFKEEQEKVDQAENKLQLVVQEMQKEYEELYADLKQEPQYFKQISEKIRNLDLSEMEYKDDILKACIKLGKNRPYERMHHLIASFSSNTVRESPPVLSLENTNTANNLFAIIANFDVLSKKDVITRIQTCTRRMGLNQENFDDIIQQCESIKNCGGPNENNLRYKQLLNDLEQHSVRGTSVAYKGFTKATQRSYS